jgi:DNA polymerase-4
MRTAGWVGRTVVLKLRYSDFSTITRSRTLSEATDVGRRIYEEARAIYEAIGAHAPVRLIGVRMEQLSPGEGQQPGLWDEDEGWRGAEDTIDAVSARFGRGALRPASLLRSTAPLGDPRNLPRQEH